MIGLGVVQVKLSLRERLLGTDCSENSVLDMAT